MSRSAGPPAPIEGPAVPRPTLPCRALLLRASARPEGTGAPSPRRGRLALAVVLAFAAFATLASSASAATAKMGAISEVTYTSAHVDGKVSTSGFSTAWSFEYSTDGENWAPAPGGSGSVFEKSNERSVGGTITVPEGGTEYFIRLSVSGFGDTPAVDPVAPGPYPSFTTLAADPPTIPGAVAATPVFSTSATATAKVVRPAQSDDINCHFEYITDQQLSENEAASEPPFTSATTVSCAQNPIGEADAGIEKEVTAPLAGLSPATAYHLRLVAENAAPGVVVKEAASTFTTAPKVAGPTVVSVQDATEVGQNTAAVSGEVGRPAGADPALDVECRFEYATQAEWEAASDSFPAGAPSTSCAENPITAASADSSGRQKVGAELGGLKPATIYHLRLAAQNGGGTDTKEAAGTFTTTPAELPVVTIDPVEGGTYTTAHVTGTVDIDDPGHNSAYVAIEISEDGGQTWPGFNASEVGGANHAGVNVVERNFTGLQPDATYTFRIKATYSGGFPPETEANGEMALSPEPNPSITTGELFPPTAENLQVTPVPPFGAHFSATVDPNAPAGPLSEAGKKAFATHWEFVCTPECKNANGNPIEGTVQGEEGAQIVGGDAKRLEGNTEYSVSLVVKSEGGEETLGPVTYQTEIVKPTVTVAPGGSDGKGGYTLQGVVNPNGSEVSACEFKWGPNSSSYAFSAPCSPPPGSESKPVTVEAHLTGLNPGVVYHYDLLATNGAGTEESGDHQFVAILNPAEACSNQQLRVEANSLALPECRAYEMVSAPGKEGFGAKLKTYDGGDRVAYASQAGNIARSGQGKLTENRYVSARSLDGWKTIPDLNGSSGSVYDAPYNIKVNGTDVGPSAYSSDLLSSVWNVAKAGPSTKRDYYLRQPNGSFTVIGPGVDPQEGKYSYEIGGTSDDLSHLFITSTQVPTLWGPGVYEFLGTGNAGPTRRVDVDNAGSPISTCGVGATSAFNSSDGRVAVVRVQGGCGGSNPPADELWARIDGTTSIDVSASRCGRVAPVCNGPAPSTFQSAGPDGSRVFFTTRQQLLDSDTDQGNDIYACDIPSGTPAPVGTANPCSSLTQISAGDPAGAEVETVGTTSANGDTVLFTARGVLAGEADSLGEEAVAGDHNLYAWHADAAHPAGQTSFLGRLSSDDVDAQSTPDGRYLVFTTASRLIDTDTDESRDVYRYSADTGELTRVSTDVAGVGGNGPFDAQIGNAAEHNPTTAISDDGQKIVFGTSEALSPADGNGETDVYLWTPGRVSLISTGSAGGGLVLEPNSPNAAITGSGLDIYFQTRSALTPADGDGAVDVYDARVGGGSSFAQAPACTGETCQPDSPASSPGEEPASAQPGPGNLPLPRTCAKGKVRKHGQCVRKQARKHKRAHHKKKGHHKQHGKKGKRARSADGAGK